MTRAIARTHFHRSTLVRVLADLAAIQPVAPGHALAEQLGQWVNYTDAITLCAVHNAGNANATPTGAATPAHALAASEDFDRLRSGLEAAIRGSSLPPLEPQALEAGTARELSAAYEPFRRYYQTQQRDMQSAITPVRARVREVLARSSPALRQLAALDAAFDNILREREARLLTSVPQLLMRRFAHWVKAHPPKIASAGFGKELHTVLLAELELRLQTTRGLLEALHQEPLPTP